MEVYNDLKKDLDDYLTKTMEPINQKQLDIERKSFNKFLEKHDDRYESLKSNHTNFIWQIITLEGVIFGGIMLFHDKSFVSIYLYISLFCLLLSIILGLILQRLRISSDYWLLNFKYELRKGSNDFARKLYHDVTLDWEKDIVNKTDEEKTKNNESSLDKLFKWLHLVEDNLEVGFLLFFVVSLIFLFVHIIFINS